jgi:hypothetical protein
LPSGPAASALGNSPGAEGDNNNQACDIVMWMTASLRSEKPFTITPQASKQPDKTLSFDLPLP